METNEKNLRHVVESALSGTEYQLWGVSFIPKRDNALLRVFIEKESDENGIDVEDCAQASRVIAAELDVADVISSRYLLEVSSPGLNRQLFAPEHFMRYANHNVRLRLQRPISGRRQLLGVLLDCTQETVSLCVTDTNENVEVSLSDIKRAELHVF